MAERPFHHSGVGISMLYLAVAVSGGPARAASLQELLPAVAAEASTPRLLRADVHIERDGSAVGDAILLARGRRVYLETRAGTRALLSPGKVVVVRGGRVRRAAPDAGIEGTDILLQDLEPFGVGTLSVPQVSDEGPTGVVVTGAPKPPTPYV